LITVVVIEDELKVLEGVSTLIGKLNPHFEVIGKAQNGNAGVDLVLASNPDVVITDIKMPEKDGLEMIRELRKMGVRSQFVILTGHADFQFARQALQLGSVEYLLKPLKVADLKRTLGMIEETINSAEVQSMPLLENYSLNRVLFSVASEGNRVQTLFVDELRRRFPHDETFCNFLIHSDHTIPADQKKKMNDIVQNILDTLDSTIYCDVDFDAENEMLYFIVGKQRKDISPHITRIWRRCGELTGDDGTFCLEYFDDIERFAAVFSEMRETIRWGISFPPRTLLSGSMVKETDFVRLAYPRDIEQMLFQKISSGKLDDISQYMNMLASYLQKERYYPADLREAMFSVMSALMYAIRKVSYGIYLEINKIEIDEYIRKTNSVEAFTRVLLGVITRFTQYSRSLHECSSPLICNVLRIIEAEYNKNISLEIIADRLNLTVEYLSSLFKKEIGMGFIAYLTQFRIDRAKELLIKPNIKISTVAEQAGYNDTTYFCKVFKRVTGLSPKDYMNSVN
jgi:YesN/AraC family two-component response regulator